MREFFVGGRFFYVAFCRTIDFFYIRMGDLIEPDMTTFASQLAMNGICKQFFIDIENSFFTGFVKSSDMWISVTE